MTVPNNPGQGGYQQQPGQGGYQQPGQQGWAPSAFSVAPVPGQGAYGQQPGQDVYGQNPQSYVRPGAGTYGYNQQAFLQPRQGGGFVATFSMNFQNRDGAALARVAQLISLITGTDLALYGLFEPLAVATLGGDTLQILTCLARAVAYVAFGLFLPAFNHTILEHAVDDKEQRILRVDSMLRKDYRLITFDLSDTLVPSKLLLPDQMAAALHRLLDLVDVCMISGGQFGQFSSQPLDNLGASAKQLDRLHLIPTCGTRYMRCIDGQQIEIYTKDPTADERRRVMKVLESQARKLGLWREDTQGPVFKNRGSQITFSALSQGTPLEEKRAWDPDGRKKEALRAAGAALFPELEVRSGGSTSVDVIRKGIDKTCGIGELSSQTGVAVSDMLFVDDRLDEGSNDYPVLRLGIDAHPIDDWQGITRFVGEYAATHTPGEADVPDGTKPQSS